MDIWKADKKIMAMVSDLIAKYHPHLALIEDEIGVIFKEKASEVAGVILLGKTKKAPSLMPVLTDKKFNYKFLIEIGADEWNNTLDDRQRLALLDHHLCSMMAEENPQTGEIKYTIRPPDFVGYVDEVKRWGMWRPHDDETMSAVEKMFGNAAKLRVKKRAADSDLEEIIDLPVKDD
jgi:hypothetical protein